jgi:hypothetical protein
MSLAPPAMPAFETYGLAPGPTSVWTPGYYAPHGSSYAWTPGTWREPPTLQGGARAIGLTWVAPRYVASGGRYFFQPGRWDLPVEHRGVAFRPDIHVTAGEHLQPVAAPVWLVADHARDVGGPLRAVARRTIPEVPAEVVGAAAASDGAHESLGVEVARPTRIASWEERRASRAASTAPHPPTVAHAPTALFADAPEPAAQETPAVGAMAHAPAAPAVTPPKPVVRGVPVQRRRVPGRDLLPPGSREVPEGGRLVQPTR